MKSISIIEIFSRIQNLRARYRYLGIKLYLQNLHNLEVLLNLTPSKWCNSPAHPPFVYCIRKCPNREWGKGHSPLYQILEDLFSWPLKNDITALDIMIFVWTFSFYVQQGVIELFARIPHFPCKHFSCSSHGHKWSFQHFLFLRKGRCRVEKISPRVSRVR